MTENTKMLDIIDKFEIIEVISKLFRCRDSGDWEGLAECFHADARLNTSWFSGSAQEFVEKAKKRRADWHSTESSKHVMANPCVTLKGDRAVFEYHLNLQRRNVIDGYEFDLQTWSTCLDLFEKRDGKWRAVKRTPIYEKDRMDPYNPAEVPKSYYAQMDLSRYPAAIRYHCYSNEKKSGNPPSANLVIKGTPEEEATRKEAKEWLQTEIK